MIHSAVRGSLTWLVCGVLWATPCAAQSSTRIALETRLDSTANAMLKDLSLSSAAVAVVRGHDTLLLRAYGLADRENKRPATPGTVYEIASVTKQVTAAAIMRLVERGKVGLDDDISRYVPQFPLQGHRVTVRNLLNHTSGIHNFTNPPTRPANWTYDVPPDSIIALVARDTFDFAPGTRDAYSNTGYTLLGMIIEKASGQTYAAFLQREFFEPLGMKHTAYCSSHPTDPSVAKGYSKRNGEYVRAADNNMSIPFAAGGLCSSVADLLVWERALHEGRLLQPASYKEMTTPGRLLDGKVLSYGFGLGIGTLAGHPAVTHSGSITGFTSAQVYLPADSLSVIVFTNTSSARDPGPEPLAMDLARIVLGVPTNGFGALDRPGRPQASSVPTGAPLSEEALRAHLFAIADDSMRGRAAGSPENRKVTTYIADAFRTFGLAPAGVRGSYLQELPLSRPVLDDKVVISVAGRPLVPGTDYFARNQGAGARPIDGATVVYAGQWETSAALMPASAASGRVVLIGFASGQVGGPAKKAMEQRYATAAAICVANLDRMSADQRHNATPSLVRVDTGQPARVVVPSFFHVTDRLAEELVGTPLVAARPGQTGAVLHGAISFVALPTPASNVIAVLRGSDPRLAGEYVVVAAHNDHLGATRYAKDRDSLRAFNLEYRRRIIAIPGVVPDSTAQRIASSIHPNMDSIHRVHPVAHLDSIYNGADDDGSGTVGLIEIARAFAAAPSRPKRSILFISHTAEEMGNVGSRWFTDRPTVPLDSIVAMINLDMIGRGGVGDERNGGPDYLALVGTRRLSTELGDLVENVSVTGRFGWSFDYSYDAPGHPEQVYCRSDHTNYARFGIPIAFMITGYHADYHELTDEPQYVDYTKLAKVSRFAFEVANRVANLDHRVVVDKPALGPNRKCVQ